MDPLDPPLELQPRLIPPQSFDTTNQPKLLPSHEDHEVVGALHEPGINQPLLESSTGSVKTPISRKPVSSSDTRVNFETQDTLLDISISESVSEIEAAGDEVPVDGFPSFNSEQVEGNHDGKGIATFTPKGWPASPMIADQRGRGATFETCIYILMAIGAVMFLVFALLSASVHNTYPGTNIKYRTGGPHFYTADNGLGDLLLLDPNGTDFYYLNPDPLNTRLAEAAKLGPTILPILFAGIVGSTLRLVARWRSEKGSTLKVLEILVASRSLASTVSTIFALRTIGAMEISLILLWAMSPLAGQASLRILSTRNVTDSYISFPWIAVNTTDISLSQGYNNASVSVLDITVDYFSAMSFAPQVGDGSLNENIYGPSDASYFPVLPVTANNASWASSSWEETWQQSGTPGTNFTSLVGLRIEGPSIYFPDIFGTLGFDQTNLGPGIWYNSTLNFTVSLFEFQCPSVSEYTTNESWTSLLGSEFIHSNYSTLLQESQSGSGFFLDTNASFTSEFEGGQHVLFGSFYKSKVTLWSCLIYLNTRHATVNCVDGSYFNLGVNFVCGLASMGVPSISTATPLSNYSIAANIFGQWPIVDSGSSDTSSLTEQYIAQGADFQPSLVDLSGLDNITFATRLTTVFNTYYLTSQGNNGTLGIMSSMAATPTLLRPFTLITCNWFFFTVLTVTSIFLFLSTALSIYLQYHMFTPDILGYVSSLTTENTYVPISGVPPGSGSSLDGLHRAKLLKDMKVQIRDVQPGEQLGKFALTSEVEVVTRVRRKRRFV